ncbi:HupE/UreJ family protein [Bacillus salacetis]|uniref:HupE/UreJ family protein n=1 Tax=Bacillus salacetis TaxID=2315464 RepID=UPI003BA20799
MKKLSINFVLVMTLVLMVLPLGSNTAFAHPYSASFTTITPASDETKVQFSIDTLSIIEFIESDEPHIEKEELESKMDSIVEWVQSNLVLKANGEVIEGSLQNWHMEEKEDHKEFVTMTLSYPGVSEGDSLSLNDQFYIEDNNTRYANFLTVRHGKDVSQLVLQADNREWATLVTGNYIAQEDAAPSGEGQAAGQELKGESTFGSFFSFGIHHILTGYDHLLFLLVLLLRKQTVKNIIGVVTAFTVGHSITIALGLLDIINLPSQLVESIIALSIVYVAIENIFKKEVSHRWILAGGFGLIHGLGFAGLLQEVDIPKGEFAASLLGFNLGIEVMQLALVAVVLPIIIYLQKQKFNTKFIYSTSLLVAIVGAFWLVQRVFGL